MKLFLGEIRKMKTIYLYIGMGKAGSSSIINFLIKNREKLQEKDVFVPQHISEDYFYVPLNFVNFELLYHKISTKQISLDQFEVQFRDIFQKQIEESNCSKIILYSDEMFVLNNGTGFVERLKYMGYTVKVIAYLRDPINYITGVWGEELKPYVRTSMRIPLEREHVIRKIAYESIFQYCSVVGEENVFVRLFDPKEWINGDLIDDWLSCIGVSCTDEVKAQRIANVGYSRNLCEILLLICKLDLPLESSLKYRQEIIDANCNLDMPKIVKTLSKEYIDAVYFEYKDVLERIASFMGRKEIFRDQIEKMKQDTVGFYGIEMTDEQLRVLWRAMDEAHSIFVQKQSIQQDKRPLLVRVLLYFRKILS